MLTTDATVPGPLARGVRTCAPAAEMDEEVRAAAAFLKALSHPARLTILCHLGEGEKAVSQLEALLGMRQASVSQQLARLRAEGFVTNRRDGKAVYYALADARVVAVIRAVHDVFRGVATDVGTRTAAMPAGGRAA